MLDVMTAGSPDHPPVVLTHGVTDSNEALRDFIDTLCPRYYVLAVSSLGHGASDRCTPHQVTDSMEAALAELKDTVHDIVDTYGPVLAAGHSMGGALLAKLASLHPSYFRGVVAEDPSLFSPEVYARYVDWGSQTDAHLDAIAADPQAALAQAQAEHPAWPASEWQPWLDAKLQVDRAFVRAGDVGFINPWPWLATMKVPLAIVTSDGDDVLHGPEGITKFQALSPFVSTHLIPGGSHCVRRDQPDSFYSLIDSLFTQWLDES